MGAPPHAPGDFLMRRKSPKTHQEPPGSWTSGEGGLAPFDPPALCPSGIGGGGTGSAASSGAGAAERAADSLSFIQEKNCWMPGGQYRPYIAGGWTQPTEL